MNILRRSLLFCITIFAAFVILSIVQNNTFNWAVNALKAFTFAVFYILFTVLFEKRK